MAHQITMRENGKAEFAFSGEQAWHGLGQELTPGASIEQWVTESGLDWTIQEAPISFEIKHEEFGTLNRVYPDRKALFRSDNLKPLSIVSERYQVVQPKEVLEFFRDLTEVHGFELSAAGSLFGGTRFWATAKTGMEDVIEDSGDKIGGYLLLVTSADSTLSTQAQLTATRVVCANTMRVALNTQSKSVVKINHLKEFDPKQVKIDMGLLSEGWENYMNKLRTLSAKPIQNSDAMNIFRNLEFDMESGLEPGAGEIRRVDDLYRLYQDGAGAGFCQGNLMGVLNAYTNYYTHGRTGKRSSSSSGFWNSYFGEASKKKDSVMEDLLAMV